MVVRTPSSFILFLLLLSTSITTFINSTKPAPYVKCPPMISKSTFKYLCKNGNFVNCIKVNATIEVKIKFGQHHAGKYVKKPLEKSQTGTEKSWYCNKTVDQGECLNVLTSTKTEFQHAKFIDFCYQSRDDLNVNLKWRNCMEFFNETGISDTLRCPYTFDKCALDVDQVFGDYVLLDKNGKKVDIKDDKTRICRSDEINNIKQCQLIKKGHSICQKWNRTVTKISTIDYKYICNSTNDQIKYSKNCAELNVATTVYKCFSTVTNQMEVCSDSQIAKIKKYGQLLCKHEEKEFKCSNIVKSRDLNVFREMVLYGVSKIDKNTDLPLNHSSCRYILRGFALSNNPTSAHHCINIQNHAILCNKNQTLCSKNQYHNINIDKYLCKNLQDTTNQLRNSSILCPLPKSIKNCKKFAYVDFHFQCAKGKTSMECHEMKKGYSLEYFDDKAAKFELKNGKFLCSKDIRTNNCKKHGLKFVKLCINDGQHGKSEASTRDNGKGRAGVVQSNCFALMIALLLVVSLE